MKVDLTPRFFTIVPKKEKIQLPISFRDDVELGADKPEEGATNSKTFYQATAPTGGYKPGDIWVDTDDNNHIYRANEDLQWVSVRDGKLVGLDDSGNLIKDVINSALETSTKQILDEFTFGDSGAIAIKTDADNGLWISPTGILAKKSGATTFTIDNTGKATFAGELSAPSGTLGTITAGTITGATIQTATSGARVLLNTDKLVAYDDAGAEVLKVLISGTDVGDVIIGDFANDKGLKWDKSAGTFTVKGSFMTSASGQRVELDNDEMRFYDSSGNQVVTMGTTLAGRLYIKPYGGTGLYILYAQANANNLVEFRDTKGTATTGGTLLSIYRSSDSAAASDVTKIQNLGGTGRTLFIRNHSAVANTLITAYHLDLDKTGLFLADNTSASPNNEGLVEIVQQDASGALKTCLYIYTANNYSHFRLSSSSPSAPETGDIWFDGSDLKIRIGTTTYKFDKTAV